MHIEFAYHELSVNHDDDDDDCYCCCCHRFAKIPWNQFVTFFFLCSSPRKTSQVRSAPPLVVRDSPQSSSSSAVAIETDVKCRVCDVPADARFEPCGHVIACMECAAMLKKCFLCKVCFVLTLVFLHIGQLHREIVREFTTL